MIRTVIVDDEIYARDYITSLIVQNFSEISIVGYASQVSDAIELINNTNPDLVLLDIELMGKLSFQILNNVVNPNSFQVIFTTSHDTYALRAIKYSCLDYLLKPIDVNELNIAISKFKKNEIVAREKQLDVLMNNSSNDSENEKIAVVVHDGLAIIKLNEVLFCQSEGSYTWIHTIHGEKIISTKNLLHFEELLLLNYFLDVTALISSI